MSAQECPFCGIANHSLPGRIIYENAFSCIFLDIAGDVDGHMLAVPKKHCANVLDCDAETMHHLMDAVQTVSRHCMELGYEGVNLLNASGTCAGQSVPHFHIHIIPRKQSDGINAWPELPGSTMSLAEAEQLLKIE